MSLEQLQSQFRGELIRPEDAPYESARRVYNGMIDKRPRLIARCGDVADVMAAVGYGREKGMLTAIRSGGHNGGGFGVCDGGLVIDLSRMKDVRANPETRAVRVAGARCGARSITRPTRSGLLCRAASSRRPEWEA